jgi:superfamily II RNA helicase
VKALVNEKFFSLCQTFGPDSVGMMTGDASINRDAPIICCTAEILANMALR